MLHVCYNKILNFDILRVNFLNFTFKMTNFLTGLFSIKFNIDIEDGIRLGNE